MAGTSNTQDTKSKLLGMVQGDMGGVKKINPSIVEGPRLKNLMWKRLVSKYIKQGLSYEQIVKNMLLIDEYIETGKLTEELIRYKVT